ncbi:methylenetetrahydrofolate reductase [Brevibacterium marinum]|uniref:Methylenetetrahydrofolate reductase n=1 Tax=Brevibacterium marinum TaxID=418643 RepID=A0A846RPI2_9MICO|nr:methylenetetrahydrofolate reductase [Brevibacterium marinum]NJC55649.1 methylenetetrahydrofolate reductase (NADPH) [Brevibacterium marinum]
MAKLIAKTPQEKRALAGLLDNIGYEVMPFKSAVSKVISDVPTEVPLTITATGGKGLEPTLNATIELTEKGYTVAPHIPARLVAGPEELDQIATRLETAGVNRIFIVAGDAEQPAGLFNDALDLLKALKVRGHSFSNIGIGGYPEGHALLPDEKVNRAVHDKAPFADRILTQICFSSDTLLAWGARLKAEGIGLPTFVGMPGPVRRQKLMRISAGLGLGQSANFLKKQQNMFWRFFSPSGYTPTKLIRGLVQDLSKSDTMITGLHIFTFNDLARTEAWRRDLIEQTQ